MRSDGIRLKNIDLIHALMPYFFKRRCDSAVLVTLNIPFDPIHAYTRRKRTEGQPLSHLAVILAAAVRTIGEYPQFNRFIMNKKFYQHNDFTVAMEVLPPGAEDGVMSKLALDFDDTIWDVHQKLEAYIKSNRAEGQSNDTQTITRRFLSIPGLAFWGAKLAMMLDNFGLLPRAIINASPFHSSIFISNLASLNTPHVFHHLFEVGTASVFITIGSEQYPLIRAKDGPSAERCIPLSFTIDERITSGAYFAKCFARFRYYLGNPCELEQPPVSAAE
jgi:chloramphenicol O-acetyltransferase